MNSNELAARLHSRYRPQLEAARYIEALNLPDNIDYFILIEPGMGYLISALRERFPGSAVVALHADNGLRLTQDQYGEVPMWFPDSETSVQEFLEEAIPEAASARLIEWRPSLRVYGDVCLGLVREATEFIRRSAASRRTTSAFGRRWVRNFFRNLSLVNQTLLYRTMDMPVVITGSGPSLESAIPKIRAAREGVFVLAASSSLPALITGGIIPDMVITTDGGPWALLHLHACFRPFNTLSRRHGGHEGHGEENKILNSPCSPCPPCLREMHSEFKLAFSLSAALPSQCAAVSLLPMNDGSLWQSMALHGIGLGSILIPQRGTVTASALDLALVLSSGNIFLAGMDLAVLDIKSHARPYGFDHLFLGAASRLRPVYAQCFARSADMKAGGSHDVYAAWFKNKIASWPKRIFSLGGNHAAFEDNLPSPSLTGTAPLTAVTHNGGDYFKLVEANHSPADRRGRAVDTLVAALDNPQYAAALTGELAPLLFPARDSVSPVEIADILSLYGRSPHG